MIQNGHWDIHDSFSICFIGTIMLMDNEGKKIYDIHVDHQLFGLTKLDITVSNGLF